MKYEIVPMLMTNNRCYTNNIRKNKTGYMQHSTGTPGAKAKNFYSSWNKASASVSTEFCIDDTGIYQFLPIGIVSWHCGSTGNSTHVACEICEPYAARWLDVNWYTLSLNGKNNTSYAVKGVQNELKKLGYAITTVSGTYNAETVEAVKKFQADKGLTVNGQVDKATLHKLQARSGSYCSYIVKDNQEYFEDVYNKAVFLCAYVLGQLGVQTVTTTSVLSHAEGYAKKIASNHADVGHWFPLHGKTMDDFRNDVVSYMTTGRLPYGEDMVPPHTASAAYQEVWTKAYQLGIFDGTNPTGQLSRQDVMKVLALCGKL